MHNHGKVFRVQDPVELAQRRVQGHLLEGRIRRLHDWVVRHYLALQYNITFQKVKNVTATKNYVNNNLHYFFLPIFFFYQA